MRVLLDTNVLARMLLPSPNPLRAVDVILDAALRRACTVLMPSDLRRELLVLIASKPYLASRIERSRALLFVSTLEVRGEIPPTLFGPFQPRCRDKKDDYLLAYAESGHADYLVTDDQDLLVLDGWFPYRIVRPPELLAVLREDGLIP